MVSTPIIRTSWLPSILHHRNNIADFLRRYSLMEYDPSKFLYEWSRLWDTQTVSLTAGAAATEHFNTSTSARGSHARGLVGCNLIQAGRLPGNTSIIVTGIEVVPLGVNTTTLLAAAVLFSEHGYIDGIYVKQAPRLSPLPAAVALVDRGVQGTFTGVASAAAAISQARGTERGFLLSPESFVVIANGEEFKVPVGFNGPANMSAALNVRVNLVGLKVEAKGSGR